jgi:Carboxypeptidase regulatory-like domain
MTNTWSKSVVLFLFCLLLSSARSATAQATTTGSLTGVVADPSGSVIPGATLLITRSVVGFQRTVTANSSGEYVIPDLQAGDYALRVSANGFADSLYLNVVIATGRTYNQNIQMKIGAASDTVSVVSSGEVLETTSNTLDTTIKPDAVQDLPLNGRDALPFAQLVSGAQSGGDTRFTTYNALPAAALNITVDGIYVSTARGWIYLWKSTVRYGRPQYSLALYRKLVLWPTAETAYEHGIGSELCRKPLYSYVASLRYERSQYL